MRSAHVDSRHSLRATPACRKRVTDPVRSLSLAVLVALGFAVACKEPADPEVRAASVVLSPTDVTLTVGATRQLTVAVNDKSGNALADRVVAFSSSDPNVAAVNSSGVVLGVALGQATITALDVKDKVSGTATVSIVQDPVASVSITPAGAQTVYQGLTVQLGATLRNSTGTVLTGREVNWTTSNPTVASVSQAGLVTGLALGQTQITAESEGRTGSVLVTVSPRPVASATLSPNPATVTQGKSLQLTLDLRDSDGNQLSTVGRNIVWQSSNNPVATVNQIGVVNGVSPGSAIITVTVESKQATATVNVTPP
jgi:uncharacterized protein YjdB